MIHIHLNVNLLGGGGGGVDILTTPVFDRPLFRAEFIILLKVWMQVDKPINIEAMRKFFGNSLYVSGCRGNR